MRFLIIRPIDESAALAKKLESAGHQTVINPVLTIQSEALYLNHLLSREKKQISKMSKD